MSTLPKVSAVMPVGKGDTYYPLALACFSSQDYEGELELVVVDNSDEPISVPDDPRIRYFRVERMPVGALRNYGNTQASGEVLINWDEDDWSAPNRISFQVQRLTDTRRALTGFHNICFYNTVDGSTYKPKNSSHPANSWHVLSIFRDCPGTILATM
jgi:glycosyltransferase involved in cell wall biosynthesis